MINEIKKSFNEIIYERTTSPFYGTIIISWLIWNWRILYLTFFISEERIELNKIDYILANYSNTNHILVFPLLSTIALLTIIPFVSNGAFWLSLKFNKWKVDQKNIVDKKQLLSIEQSIELREEISKQEERFAKLVESKNLEITQLQLQIDEFKQKMSQDKLDNKLNDKESISDELKSLSERIKNNQSEMQQYEMALTLIQGGSPLTDRSDVSSKFITLLESYDIIENKVNGVYKITAKGKQFQKIML